MAFFGTKLFGTFLFGSEITPLNKKSTLKPYRKIEIKRRLNDGTGNYETDWFDVTKYIVSIGTISSQLDTERVGVFTQQTVTLIGDNTEQSWDETDVANSIFSGYLTRYKTLFRITQGLIDTDGSIYPANGSIFYGYLTDDITLDEKEATIIINSLKEAFAEQSASKLSLNSSDTASSILYKIMTIKDDNGNNVFDRFISGSQSTPTTTTYPFSSGSSTLENQTCLDVINRLCLTEDYACYIDRNGSLQFQPKTSGTEIKWKFNGVGVYDETYGVNVVEIKKSNNIWSKVFNKIVIEHSVGSYITKEETWSQGDNSSSDKYGQRVFNISEVWLDGTQAQTLADNLYTLYKDPKREVILTTTVVNPDLDLLDRVEVNYIGESSTNPIALWGEALWGIDCWTGNRGGIYLPGVEMKIMGKDVDMDNLVSTYYLREV